mmetsp:Transcript_9861/g.18407  ORF Transcript_9861/g.18407 Transcript_9861/m.18407 type:complete len:143 (-) Transcript_9861:234-662(-)|eukprot:CAMPEP_0175072922 /NCGR_PEP_ID=MMETSP0052_2-20121109/20218_1 /TAXON_ID=51329 ORGANISM="Polytomella parva, Strain SAG 63-3" /NCGR_SAMPLE_ID=MMETSP0052_2 /ASSEMBLY_ACC=CAM_ASM_000194 /LENGTH=142 /DNA_ID=CAMNT_0016340559 /DNA_START=38 /DNA_END=466 /DNA_ORIENTATION=+
MSVFGQKHLLQRWTTNVIDFFLKKELVGADKLGNQYFRWHEKNKGERREVRWQEAQFTYDPNLIPPEWRMWLKKQRKEPPTPQEILAGEMQRASMAAKVAAIEEREKLRRARQETVGAATFAAGPAPDLQQFMGTMQNEQRK